MIENSILITGAGQRVGLFLAKHFLKQGEQVFFTYKTPRAEVRELIKQGAVGFKVDFTNEQQVGKFLIEIKKQVTSIKLLIHNASVWLKDSDIDNNLFKEMVALHQLVPYQITMQLVEELKACQGRANVIAIADSKIKAGHKDFAAYLSTKAALKTMMDSFAKKLAPNIKVNTISPGLVVFNKHDSIEYKKQRLQKLAIPIEPTEQTILNAVEFLLKSPNSTGSNIELGHI